MLSPTIDDLPPPPSGREGWPWTEETDHRSERGTPDRQAWPRISVVTPSFNQGEYLEETIRSVLLQGYPNLEYIVIDGGSTDSSTEIIQKYEPWIEFWCSESDDGQAHAINKGLSRATGQIAAYLNSDDIYFPGALQHVGQTFVQKRNDVFVGRRPPSPPIGKLEHMRQSLRPFVYPFLLGGRFFRYQLPQECIFWDHKKYGKYRFDETFDFCLDFEWFVRIFSGANIVHSNQVVGFFRSHPQNKSSRLSEVCRSENARIKQRYGQYFKELGMRHRLAILMAYRLSAIRTVIGSAIFPNRTSFFSYRLPNYLLANDAC